MPNPNLPPTHNFPPGHIDGLSEPLQIYSIESLRDQQVDLLTNALDQEAISQGRSLTDAEKDAVRGAEYAKYDSEIEAYLAAHGIDTTHPDFAAYRDKLKELSIDQVSPTDWNVSPVDPNDSSNFLPSPRDLAMNDLATNFAAPVAPPAPVAPAPVTPTPAAPATPPATTGPTPITQNPAAHMALDRARADLAAVTAKRQGRLNFKFIPGYEERTKEFERSQDEYEKRIIDLVRDELQKEIAAGNYPDEADQRLYVAARVMNSYKELQEASNEAMENTKVGKFIKFMTRGGTVKRIIKGVGLGVVAGGVGMLASAATGGAGVGAVIATGATVTSRLARGYAAFDAKAGRGMEVKGTDEAAQKEMLAKAGLENEAADAVVLQLSIHLLKDLEAQTDAQVKKRRASVGLAVLTAVVGSGIAIGIHEGYDAITSHGLSGGHPQGSGVTHTDKPGGSGTTHPQPGTVEPQAPKTIEYSSDAYRISPGEGFYQTFQDMDIPQKDWSGLLERVGPQLHDMQAGGHSLAYRMPNGEWGIRMTADGKMPQEALDAITRAHDQMTGHVTAGVNHVEAPSGAGVTPDTAPSGGTATSEAPATQPANVADIKGLVQQTDISAADIEGNSAMEAITHVSPNFSPEGLGQRLNLPASEWLRLQEYIVGETNDGNKMYTSIFSVNGNGYLRFTGNHIPAGTMADILMHIPSSVRYGLAA